MHAEIDSSEDSDIEVIACYRQLPVQPQPSVAGRQMTTDLSDCADSGFPDFPWDDFDSILQSTEADPLDRGAGPSEATRTGNPLISHCGQLQPQIDTPLSPPLHERGARQSPVFTRQQLDQPIPLSSRIQGISVRMAAHCGQPNTTQYGDCIICGRNYEQIKETSVLSYLEATTYRGETYGERLRRRDAYLAGMDQGTVLFVPRECRRLPPVMATTTRFCWKEIIQTLLQGHSLFSPSRHSVSVASTNFNFMIIETVIFYYVICV